MLVGNSANNNGWHGIHVHSSDNAEVADNTVSLNVVTGVMISSSSDNTTVNTNNIFGNLVHGLNNNTVNDVTATNNWWGPGGTGTNAERPGEDGNNGVVDSSTGTTDFTPWSNVKF